MNLANMTLFTRTLQQFALCILLIAIKISAATGYQESLEIKTEKPLKISILSENAPYSLQLPDGRMIGFYVDFWQLWSKTNHIKIEFVAGDYNQNIKAIKSGSVDFHSGLFASKDRSLWADYSLPIDRINTALFYLNSRSKPINNIVGAKGLKIAIQPLTLQANELPKKYPEMNFIKVSHFNELIKQLVSGELDAIIGEVYPIKNAFKKMGAQGIIAQAHTPVASNNVYALIPKGNPDLVTKINNGIKAIPIEALVKLAEKWIPEQEQSSFNRRINESIGLSKDEKYYIDTLGDLNLGIGKYWKPIEFLTDDFKLQGMSSDYIARLKQDLGIHFNSDYRLSWAEVNEGIKNKTVDVLSAVGITDERKKYLTFTKPYLKIPMVIVVKKNSIFVQKPEDLVGYRVGASLSNPIKDLWNRNYPNVPLEVTQSSNHGLQAVQDGELDAFIANLITIGPKIKDTFTELEVVAITPHNIEVAMGVRKGLEELIPILNKWLASISSADKLDIRKVWLSSELKQGKSFFEYAIQWSPFVFLGLLVSAFIIRKNILLAKNIKERKVSEVKLEQAKRQSQIANKNKEQFLANMSHEVRTPINALIGTAHLLEQSGLEQSQLDHIETINFSANSLLMLVEDISDFSKIESGILSLDKKPFYLEGLVKKIFSQANINNSLSDINLNYTISENTPSKLYGDPNRVGQIITNLLSNSIKFTKEGFINLSINTNNPFNLAKNQSSVFITCKIEDSGIGMTKEQQKRLFQAYSQTDISIARKYGGTGLGLTICKKLSELMNGKITVESQIDMGSTFTFTLQLEAVSDSESLHKLDNNGRSLKKSHKANLKGKKILLVDDNLVNLMIAKKILLSHEIQVTTAINGQLAIDAFNEQSFDLVIMDIQMPVMDGYQATKIIRQKLNQNIPIIALSANVMENDIKLSRDAGMNDHLGKPVIVDDLIKTLSFYLS